MIISIRKLMEGLKYLLIFLVCTMIFYGIVSFFAEVIRPADPYQKPEGKAIKVDRWYMEEEPQSDWDWFRERLMFYYWYGE